MQHRKFLRALILLAALVLAACGSPEQRAADYVAKAQKFYDAGDYVKARLEAQNAVQVEPKNAQARYLLAEVAEQEKDYKNMFGHLSVVVDLDPNNVEARLKLGTLYFLGQAWPQAGEQADALLKLAPNDARVHLLHARVLVQKGDQAGGIAEIETAMKLDPDNVEGLLLQSSAYAMESIDKGLANIDKAIARLGPAKTRPLRELRVVMLSQGKRDADVEHDLQALAADFPKEGGYQFQLARFYASQGRIDEADKLLKSVSDLDPTDMDKRLGYVQFLATARDPERAEAALKTFIEQTPDAGKLRLALAQLYEQSKRYDDARATYQQLADRDPKSTEGLAARNRIAALDLRDNKVDAARANIEKILADVPDDPNALLLRGGIRVSEGKYGDAIADLRLVLRKDEKSDRALLLLAQAYVRTNDMALAKDTYRRLLEVNPDSAEGLQQLAVLFAAEKNFTDAEALLRRRLNKHPDDLVTSGRLVEVLMAQGKPDAAEAEARRMMALTNQTGVGDFELGRVLAQKKDLAGATAAFRKSVASRKGDPLPLEGLVSSLMAQGKSDEAIGVLNDQLDNSQNQLFAKFLLGGIYGQQGNLANAEKYLEEVIKEKPDSSIAYISLAGIYTKDREARIRTYRRGIAAIPANTDLPMLLGSELEQAQRFDEAIAVYEGVVKQNPTYVPGLNNLVSLLTDHRTDKASISRALELAKPLAKEENPAMLDTLGWVYYKSGQPQEAASYLERAVAKAGQVPVFRYHLGMAYAATGNKVGARQQLDEALKQGAADFQGKAEAQATRAKL